MPILTQFATQVKHIKADKVLSLSPSLSLSYFLSHSLDHILRFHVFSFSVEGGGQRSSVLTYLEVGDLAPDPRAGGGAGGDLHAVAHPGGQARDQRGERRTIHCTVHVVTALITQTPDLGIKGETEAEGETDR